MQLLIDAGNTRIKWALWDGTLGRVQAVTHDQLPALAAAWQPLALQAVHAANVAHEHVRQAIEQASPLPVQWQHPCRLAGGIHNHYRHLPEQGTDRWLAVLGARQLQAGPVVVASAGTALTVEALTADNQYLGGTILPGYRLMLQSLAQHTARLDRPAGHWQPFPAGTEDAIASGVLDALAGAILRMQQRLAEAGGEPPCILLTGGDAPLLAAVLPPDTRMVDNLVLYGLASVANGS